MIFKTLLRKWHTWLGLIISIPMTVLIISGVYLLNPPLSKHVQLIETATCSNGQLLIASSSGLYLDSKIIPTIFSLESIGAMSCTDSKIDIALNYGPIYSTNLNLIRWNQINTPFSQPIKHLSRMKQSVHVTLLNDIWLYQFGEWQMIQSFQPTLSQKIYKLHAGWFQNWSFQWVWLVTSILWLILIISGVWIFMRMRNLKANGNHKL
jgi:hypothetical protein